MALFKSINLGIMFALLCLLVVLVSGNPINVAKNSKPKERVPNIESSPDIIAKGEIDLVSHSHEHHRSHSANLIHPPHTPHSSHTQHPHRADAAASGHSTLLTRPHPPPDRVLPSSVIPLARQVDSLTDGEASIHVSPSYTWPSHHRPLPPPHPTFLPRPPHGIPPPPAVPKARQVDSITNGEASIHIDPTQTWQSHGHPLLPPHPTFLPRPHRITPIPPIPSQPVNVARQVDSITNGEDSIHINPTQTWPSHRRPLPPSRPPGLPRPDRITPIPPILPPAVHERAGSVEGPATAKSSDSKHSSHPPHPAHSTHYPHTENSTQAQIPTDEWFGGHRTLSLPSFGLPPHLTHSLPSFDSQQEPKREAQIPTDEWFGGHRTFSLSSFSLSNFPANTEPPLISQLGTKREENTVRLTREPLNTSLQQASHSKQP